MTELKAVRGWLEKTGFPFEFEVAAAFRDAGFDVHQGIHYPPDSPDAIGARDIDVLAVRDQLVATHPATRCTVLYVIECKTSAVPWLILRGTERGGKWEAAGRFLMNALSETDLLSGVEWEDDPWLLRLPPEHGFRVVVAGAGAGAGSRSGEEVAGSRSAGRDPAFDATRQSISAAEGVLRANSQHLPTIAIPVLAVSPSVYGVAFGAEGEAIHEVGWERVLWRAHRSAAALALDVVGKGTISEYARLAWDGAGEILPILRAAALARREDDMRRAAQDVGVLDRAGYRMQDAVESIETTVARVRRVIRSRLF